MDVTDGSTENQITSKKEKDQNYNYCKSFISDLETVRT